jgi:hypothetical protein
MGLEEVESQRYHESAFVCPHTQVHDEIFLLGGCSKPVIFRRNRSNNELDDQNGFATSYKVVGGSWLDLDTTANSKAAKKLKDL